MKTKEIVSMSESELAPKLKHMKTKELEKHAQKLLRSLGQLDYDTVMGTVIKAIPKLDTDGIDRFMAVQNIIRSLVPTASNDSDDDKAVIERLTVIIMVIITQKFQKILAKS